jgi:tRNA modification GTPase
LNAFFALKTKKTDFSVFLHKKYRLLNHQETICALATPQGIGALAIIRVSGNETFEIVNKILKGPELQKVAANTVHYAKIMDGDKMVDEVLISVFKAPKSFTKEDAVEISTHGSEYIVRFVLKLLIQKGCRMANPGEFTQRAFLNGQFDLAQAEAVADLIAADSEASHQIAIHQLRGGFSKKLAVLREKLVHFASLVELELDFGEEDVEFADRDDLKALINELQRELIPLIASFENGNAIKEGIPVAIIGAPNAGKSTLLNTLLNEEKAIVTDIAGTTRDVIEDVVFIEGRKFRFIDTAGIRHTEDIIESMGIERSRKAMHAAKIVIFLFDNEPNKHFLEQLEKETTNADILWVQNKIDLNDAYLSGAEIKISAKNETGIEALKHALLAKIKLQSSQDTTITNLRHYEHLLKANEALSEVLSGLALGVTGDFLAQDIRLSLHHLGEITGTITTEDLLSNIFGKFCIGK